MVFEALSLHITEGLERLQPFKNGLVLAPRRSAAIADRFHLGDCLAFHFEINGGITIGCVRAGMAQPLTDSYEVDARLQERHGGTVTHAVRVETFASESSDICASSVQMFGQDVPNPKAS